MNPYAWSVSGPSSSAPLDGLGIAARSAVTRGFCYTGASRGELPELARPESARGTLARDVTELAAFLRVALIGAG
jgi:hypothetical protein